MIATLGGRFGGYALLLSHSFNWWLKSESVQANWPGLLVLGLLLVWFGKISECPGNVWLHLLIRLPRSWLLAVFATELFGIGKGRPVFVYNFLDLERFRWAGLSGLSAGKHTIVFDFKYDGPGPAKGGTGVLSVDGKEVARKTIEHTIPLLMTSGRDVRHRRSIRARQSMFTYEAPFRFTGTIDRLNYKLGPEQLSAEDKQDAAKKLAAAKD